MGQMAIKVYFEKTYDRLSWNFIYETLCLAGVLMDLVRVIMECISSLIVQLLWNRELTKSFIPSRGIRQGDPILPYIFMLCIDRLRHGINQVVREGRWEPIKLARQVIPITHVFFIDDLLLLVIKDVLNSFCVSFGEKVSTSKMLTFFSHNVNVVDVKKIREKLGFTTTKDLGNYLGMPLLHMRISK